MLYQSCWNNLVTGLIVPSSLLQFVNSLFQTCSNKFGTSSANTSCQKLVNRLVTTCLQVSSNLCVFTCVVCSHCCAWCVGFWALLWLLHGLWISPVQTSKFSLTSFLTSSLTCLYDGQVFLDRLYLFQCLFVQSPGICLKWSYRVPN